jgi:mRNA-degrading endonuclease toxin of MazEF toxin-antitoxin module
MAKILRGDIRWADLDPTRGHEQAGKRPELIIRQDIAQASPEELNSVISGLFEIVGD